MRNGGHVNPIFVQVQERLQVYVAYGDDIGGFRPLLDPVLPKKKKDLEH